MVANRMVGKGKFNYKFQPLVKELQNFNWEF